MKKKNLLMIGLGLITSSVFAQNGLQVPQLVKVEDSTVKTEVTNKVSSTGNGNVLEKELTPLLRELSIKKTRLELKKLDKEIEKLDEVPKDSNQNQLGQLGPLGGQLPMAMPMGGLQQSSAIANPNAAMVDDEIKVLLIYGTESDLYAKLAMGKQGGFIVKKGDIAPNGKSVVKITKFYIELKEESSKNKTVNQKIYITSNGSNPTGTGTTTGSSGALNSSAPSGGTVDSTSSPALPSAGIQSMLKTLK